MERTSGRFAGHQSFALRNTWLTKGVTGCAERPDILRSDEAIVAFGVGKNMVDSIRYWCEATRMLKLDESYDNNRGYYYQPTKMGRKLFIEEKWDPYLEDTGTLWLIHYLLATNWDQATTTCYLFNEFNQADFAVDELRDVIGQLAAQLPDARAAKSTVRRDVNVFLQLYAGRQRSARASIEDYLDCPLAELNLIVPDGQERTYAFSRGPKPTLPTAIVIFALNKYVAEYDNRQTFTFDELAYRTHSPGRVFKLDEPSLAEYLERISEATDGAWQPTETAGFRQMLVTAAVDGWQVLSDYYGSSLDGERYA